GLFATTLRYPYEVRKAQDYFDDIAEQKIPKDMLDLAAHIVDTKAGHFEPEKFEDRYEQALVELIRRKQAGERVSVEKPREPAKVISLMDALRRSVEAGKGPARSAPARGGGRRERSSSAPPSARTRAPARRGRGDGLGSGGPRRARSIRLGVACVRAAVVARELHVVGRGGLGLGHQLHGLVDEQFGNLAVVAEQRQTHTDIGL